MQIGRRIYYEIATGNIIQNTGERSGNVVETTIEQDFATYSALAGRVPSTVGCMQLEYGEYAQDFAECNGYRVDVSGETPSLLFSYPDPEAPEEPPVYRKPLSEEVAEVKAQQALMQAALDDLILGGGI
ncbi:hypothetical protein ACF3MZ_29190 [Paenibacillaceae bacterium WGS1546]|uniref:hypothetical protein n=1 Tax=Cohnella sp. WGS1546 TaxID=3366810 RepID=UPI00372D0A1B